MVPEDRGRIWSADSMDTRFSERFLAPSATLDDLRCVPISAELARIVKQAVRIHAVDEDPEFVFDPWVITHLGPLTERAATFPTPSAASLRKPFR